VTIRNRYKGLRLDQNMDTLGGKWKYDSN
jgi:hypothetical protein